MPLRRKRIVWSGDRALWDASNTYRRHVLTVGEVTRDEPARTKDLGENYPSAERA